MFVVQKVGLKRKRDLGVHPTSLGALFLLAPDLPSFSWLAPWKETLVSPTIKRSLRREDKPKLLTTWQQRLPHGRSEHEEADDEKEEAHTMVPRLLKKN